MMIVDVDPNAGFCRGVQRAIRKSEAMAEGRAEVFSLGPLVHNEKEVERLARAGIRVISHDELDGLGEGSVIIRAHGEPPETYQRAEKRGLEVIDTTCPVVLKVQEKIRKAARQVRKNGGVILIYGKREHPEVKGLAGQTDGTVVVVQAPEEIPDIQGDMEVYLFSQTTMSGEGFDQVAEAVRKKMKNPGKLKPHKTICGQVYGRAPGLRRFAADHDVIIFLSGENSSNGRYLFNVCREVNPNSHFISWANEFRTEWLRGASSVGISGAASTPYTDLEELAERIKSED
jgi:(E)-4-hydroxy-3-methyl-but-2-enyl pyrophosphate reductase